VVNRKGETEAYVLKGKIGLRSGSDPVRIGDSRILTEGQAGMIDTVGNITERKFRPNRTVLEIPRQRGFAIPGRRLDLADVVGDGNGFGTGHSNSAIDVLDGGVVVLSPGVQTLALFTEVLNDYPYLPVTELDYVDGVFVPIHSSGQVTVSSSGHKVTIDPVPLHMQGGDRGIANRSWRGNRLLYGSADLRLNGQAYGFATRPAILMRRHKGITFDLDAIRANLPNTRIARFTALCGISELEAHENKEARASFYVLLDGKVEFSRHGLSGESGGIPIRVPIAEEDRFLTLVTVFTVVPSLEQHRGMFAQPALELAPITNRSDDSNNVSEVDKGGDAVAEQE